MASEPVAVTQLALLKDMPVRRPAPVLKKPRCIDTLHEWAHSRENKEKPLATDLRLCLNYLDTIEHDLRMTELDAAGYLARVRDLEHENARLASKLALAGKTDRWLTRAAVAVAGVIVLVIVLAVVL